MGPKRITNEPLSKYRNRYAGYCLRWVILLLLPLVLLFAVAPSVNSFPVPLLLMFLYIGLPLGLTVAALAAFGFMVGGLWASVLEHHPRVAYGWPKAKVTLKAFAVAPVLVFCVHVISSGVVDKKVFILQRGKGLPMVGLADEPLGYLACMSVWCVLTIGLAVYLSKELRRAYAT